MFRDLSAEEVEYVSGGVAPAVPILVGAAGGAGLAFVNELRDNRPGIDFGNVLIGGAAGAIGGAAAIAGAIPAVLGSITTGVVGGDAIAVVNSIRDEEARRGGGGGGGGIPVVRVSGSRIQQF